jgi:YD repeat-containing protein
VPRLSAALPIDDDELAAGRSWAANEPAEGGRAIGATAASKATAAVPTSPGGVGVLRGLPASGSALCRPRDGWELLGPAESDAPPGSEAARFRGRSRCREDARGPGRTAGGRAGGAVSGGSRGCPERAGEGSFGPTALTLTRTDPPSTTTTYDARGWITRITSHDGTHTDFGYDQGGRRTSVTDPAGHTTY